MEDRCVICGKPIPEGRFVCWGCLNEEPINRDNQQIIMNSISREIYSFAHRYGKYPDRVFVSDPVFRILDYYRLPPTRPHKDGITGMIDGIPVVRYFSPEYEFYLSGDKGTFYNINDDDRIFVRK